MFFTRRTTHQPWQQVTRGQATGGAPRYGVSPTRQTERTEVNLNNEIENVHAMSQVSADIAADMKVVILCNVVEILLDHAPEQAKDRVAELLKRWK